MPGISAIRNFALAAGVGALSIFAWAPVAVAPLLWATLAWLYVRLFAAPSARAALPLALGFSLGLYLAGVSWVFVSLSVFGGLPAPLAALATFFYCLLLALFPALLLTVFARFRGQHAWPRLLLFAAAWALADWLRGWVFTGFPWLALGYTQTPGGWPVDALAAPLTGFAPLFGVFGLSLLVALLGGGLGEVWLRMYSRRAPQVATSPEFCKPLPLVAVLLGLPVAGVALSRLEWTTPAGAPIDVALLQGNIGQDLKWNPGRFAATLRTYHELAREHPAALTVMPETALPTFFDQLPPEYLRALDALARRRQGDIVIGAVVGDAASYSNSVVSLGSAPRQRYDKSHLVPFGEFPPPGFSWFMRRLNIPMAGFTPGPAIQPPFELSGQQVAFNICYEDVFGDEIIRVLPQATILVNVSNTAWFGRSWAQPQHLQIARLRALETGRPMLRATNTGMTAAIAPDGRLIAALPPFTRGALTVAVQGMRGLTPFARWGNLAALLLIVLFSLPALVRAWKSR